MGKLHFSPYQAFRLFHLFSLNLHPSLDSVTTSALSACRGSDGAEDWANEDSQLLKWRQDCHPRFAQFLITRPGIDFWITVNRFKMFCPTPQITWFVVEDSPFFLEKRQERNQVLASELSKEKCQSQWLWPFNEILRVLALTRWILCCHQIM